jgi:hypothetical protein
MAEGRGVGKNWEGLSQGGCYVAWRLGKVAIKRNWEECLHTTQLAASNVYSGGRQYLMAASRGPAASSTHCCHSYSSLLTSWLAKSPQKPGMPLSTTQVLPHSLSEHTESYSNTSI